jgi:hypothetical protein
MTIANLNRKCSVQDDVSAVWELDTASLKGLKKAVYFSGPLSAAKRRKDSARARPMPEPPPVMSIVLPVICMWDWMRFARLKQDEYL